MTKKIEMTVESCKDCPFFKYPSKRIGRQCTYPVYMDDSPPLPLYDSDWFRQDTPPWCPFPDSEESRKET